MRLRYQRPPVICALGLTLFGMAAITWMQVRGADEPAAKPAEQPASQQPSTPAAGTQTKPTTTSAGLGTPNAGVVAKEHAEPGWKKLIAAWRTQKNPEPADNSYCYVCHLSYQQEELAKIHQPKGVGCETCHGISDKHSEDEDNLTPPEVMVSRKSVFAFCLSCHEKEKLAKVEDHAEILATPPQTSDTCTECHGLEHRMKVRTRKWDKDTGKVLWYDGVRMMQKRPAGDK